MHPQSYIKVCIHNDAVYVCSWYLFQSSLTFHCENKKVYELECLYSVLYKQDSFSNLKSNFYADFLTNRTIIRYRHVEKQLKYY